MTCDCGQNECLCAAVPAEPMSEPVNGLGETPAEYWRRRFQETCDRLDESGQQVIVLWAEKRRLRADVAQLTRERDEARARVEELADALAQKEG